MHHPTRPRIPFHTQGLLLAREITPCAGPHYLAKRGEGAWINIERTAQQACRHSRREAHILHSLRTCLLLLYPRVSGQRGHVVAELLAAARNVGWQRPRAANMLIAGASRVEVVQEFTAGTSRASCKQLHAANLLTTGVSRWWVGKAHTMRIRLLIRNQRGVYAKRARCEHAYY